ncbi:MAG: 1-deoxy-D-xylulose-5-phosphate reductoisomerase [Desulfobacteraceae bacterium]|nr:1-deoxy-D-xylulose-5-phosphate reductoisomerase [Desulfobacteraceae bacterium]
MKKLAILGSTGSIGQSTLKIVSLHPDRFDVEVLTAAYNIFLLSEQIKQFDPKTVVVMTEQGASQLKTLLKGEKSPEILIGEQGYIAAASNEKADIVFLAMVGAAGLRPALAAIDSRKIIALANKETLVMAGDIVMAKARENNVPIYPVDSEHSAIFQCLQGNKKKDFKKIFLTASGGPFRQKKLSEFESITPEDALNHPNWSMGSKISIDSATLMNKGLEIIEAVHLFNVSHEDIEVLIHPQSIVHSMVGFKDGSVIAQMGIPDMKGAISYAMSFPERLDIKVKFPDFTTLKNLEFEKPDTEKFPSLNFAFEVCKQGGTLPAVMNAANEVAVEAFLSKKINFPAIFSIISKCLEKHNNIDKPDLSGIIDSDRWARETALSLI